MGVKVPAGVRIEGPILPGYEAILTPAAVAFIVLLGTVFPLLAEAVRVFGRVHVLVGLLSGLWSLMLIRIVPAGLPIAPGLWDAPTVLVLFSGGQDSATCLAWALDRFERVETVGFDYRQRHRVELDCRPALIAEPRCSRSFMRSTSH